MRIIPITVIASFCFLIQSVFCRPSLDAIKLDEIKVLTFYYWKMTTGRRYDPIPQLRCVGGSAGCNAFIPLVVQCENKGPDGISLKWECKANMPNMDNAFKLGQIKLGCEGYGYPGDSYVLKGSCSLEYTIDMMDGHQNQGIKHQNYENIPSDAIKSEDMKTITLHNGKMTTSRRTAPVPQLKCVGGSAGCSAFIPQIVQCENKGSHDGVSDQWVCKTDMPNAFRFGKAQVGCEGYAYPNDQYVLKESCALEYTVDLAGEGLQ